MDKRNFKIIDARKEDATLIARAVTMAIGEEICRDLAGSGHTPGDVEAMFAELAAMVDSQYSYRNAVVAIDDDGNVAGICIGYDGASLHSLRERFFEAYSRRFGRDMRGVTDETTPDEYYIDTLAVFPHYRGCGIGSDLLLAQAARGHAIGKPAGLLVDKANPKAEALYIRCGFTYAGERPFAGVVMNHLTLEPTHD